MNMKNLVVGSIGGVLVFVLGNIFFHNYNIIPLPMKKDSTEEKFTNPKQMPNMSNLPMYACPHQSDCWKFQKMLKEKWDPQKPKAAVYILIKRTHVQYLVKTLTDLQTNFLSKYSYPVIIFHEKDFVPLIPKIRSVTKLNIFFQEVQFETPAFLHPSATKVFECGRRELGYRHMCRFQAKLVYELPIMRHLAYYLRLDAHSYIYKPVPYDLFKHMKDNDLLYLYPCVYKDALPCIRYLWDAVNVFVKLKRIKPQFMEKFNDSQIFFNNFEMARMDVFTGAAYQNYINYIDQLGGIYHNRWGDAPIKSLAVSIFLRENQTRQIYDVAYNHHNDKLLKGVSTKPASNRCYA